MKILAPVDGSSYTKRMLAYLAAHEEWMGPHHQYTLLNVQPTIPGRAISVIDKATLKAYYESEAEKVFKPIRSFFKRKTVPVEFMAKVGHAAEIIAQVAEKGRFELIVLGSHGQGSMMNLVMGSVATKVIAGCKVPVLLIR